MLVERVLSRLTRQPVEERGVVRGETKMPSQGLVEARQCVQIFHTTGEDALMVSAALGVDRENG